MHRNMHNDTNTCIHICMHKDMQTCMHLCSTPPTFACIYSGTHIHNSSLTVPWQSHSWRPNWSLHHRMILKLRQSHGPRLSPCCADGSWATMIYCSWDRNSRNPEQVDRPRRGVSWGSRRLETSLNVLLAGSLQERVPTYVIPAATLLWGFWTLGRHIEKLGWGPFCSHTWEGVAVVSLRWQQQSSQIISHLGRNASQSEQTPRD